MMSARRLSFKCALTHTFSDQKSKMITLHNQPRTALVTGGLGGIGVPAGRAGTPRDIAGAVSFLASDAPGYITGTNLSINGGLYMYQ
jgi:hypothetical protein